MPAFTFDAYVVSVLFAREGALFALGDGTVRTEAGDVRTAHEGAVLAAAVHPSGDGVVTGGDDGRVVWTTPDGCASLAEFRGRWIDALAASDASGLIAIGCGREVQVRDARDPSFARSFAHERSVADLAFDPKGRRLACATYGGATLWYARIADQKPQMLRWAGSHIGAIWSPDGRFLVSSMQEGALHGWRLSDAKDMRMSGYPSKVKSLAFLSKGQMLATSGAPGAVLWPFTGPNGPMGKEAVEIGFDETTLLTRVAAAPSGSVLAAGLADGRVWTAELQGRGLSFVKRDKGPPITALAVSADGRRLAWGDEAGSAGSTEL